MIACSGVVYGLTYVNSCQVLLANDVYVINDSFIMNVDPCFTFQTNVTLDGNRSAGYQLNASAGTTTALYGAGNLNNIVIKNLNLYQGNEYTDEFIQFTTNPYPVNFTMVNNNIYNVNSASSVVFIDVRQETTGKGIWNISYNNFTAGSRYYYLKWSGENYGGDEEGYLTYNNFTDINTYTNGAYRWVWLYYPWNMVIDNNRFLGKNDSGGGIGYSLLYIYWDDTYSPNYTISNNYFEISDGTCMGIRGARDGDNTFNISNNRCVLHPEALAQSNPTGLVGLYLDTVNVNLYNNYWVGFGSYGQPAVYNVGHFTYMENETLNCSAVYSTTGTGCFYNNGGYGTIINGSYIYGNAFSGEQPVGNMILINSYTDDFLCTDTYFETSYSHWSDGSNPSVIRSVYGKAKIQNPIMNFTGGDTHNLYAQIVVDNNEIEIYNISDEFDSTNVQVCSSRASLDTCGDTSGSNLTNWVKKYWLTNLYAQHEALGLGVADAFMCAYNNNNSECDAVGLTNSLGYVTDRWIPQTIFQGGGNNIFNYSHNLKVSHVSGTADVPTAFVSNGNYTANVTFNFEPNYRISTSGCVVNDTCGISIDLHNIDGEPVLNALNNVTIYDENWDYVNSSIMTEQGNGVYTQIFNITNAGTYFADVDINAVANAHLVSSFFVENAGGSGGGLTVIEHGWLEDIHNCIIDGEGDCFLKNRLLRIISLVLVPFQSPYVQLDQIITWQND